VSPALDAPRGWGFVHPDFAGEGTATGVRVRAGQGVVMVEGDAAVRQALLLLLSTTPGERVMRPEYGCDLQRLVFSPNDDTTAGLVIHYIRQAIARFEPRIEVLRLDAGAHPVAATVLEIALAYRVRATQRTEDLRLVLDLQGGPA
jgi:uncharacterized protein